MTIYVFGNQDLNFDNIPTKILHQLQSEFPHIHFEHRDPNEDMEFDDDCVIIDTVQGIDAVTVFADLQQFVSAPHISMHDLDLYATLRLMQKLGKIKQIYIIGVPQTISVPEAFDQTKMVIASLLSKNETRTTCTDHTRE